MSASERSMIVTGAAGGIGLGIAQAAAEAGYRVGIFDIAGADEAATSIGARGFTGSVDDPEAVNAMLDTFGTPTTWVNNAGIVRFGPLVDLSLGDFEEVVQVNLVGTFLCCQQAAKRMATNGGGSIVNITSMNGVAPGPNAGSYGAAKAGVALLTQQMAIEWGAMGIRVNAVAPGLIDGGMSAPIYADSVIREARESKVPVGRLGTPTDIANAVLFLAGDDAAYITGQNLVVDGGVTMSIIANLPRPASVDGAGPSD